MPYEPLHHKYRPQTFAELVGQQAIAQTLSNALRQNQIAPAYLFTGARGTGKTSSARIFAKSLNCTAADRPTDQPCGHCDICQSIARGAALDVIEIDAASNTGVDNIRELIERAQFAPVQCRYKVYVIDEVHMLSTAAFNALLKTLEEPPERVVFILATTDPQKVLPTIISRCQQYPFRRIPLEDMVAHLGAIAAKEQIAITPEAVQLVAQLSQGGLRDAESMLDQLSLLEDQISAERVWELVGAVPERDLMGLLQGIAADDPAALLDRARNLMDRGREPLIVLQNLASFYRDLLIAKTAPERSDLIAVTPDTWRELCQFAQSCEVSWITAGQQLLRSSEVQIRNANQPRLWLEVTLMGLLPSAIAPQAPQPTPSTPPTPPPAHSPQPAEPTPPPAHSLPTSTEPPQPPHPPPAPTPTEPPQPTPPTSPNITELWQEILNLVPTVSTRAMLKQQCQLLEFDGAVATIGVRSKRLFNLAKERMPQIEEAFKRRCKTQIPVKLKVMEEDAAPATAPSSSPSVPPPLPTPAPAPPESRSSTPPPSSEQVPPLEPPADDADMPIDAITDQPPISPDPEPLVSPPIAPPASPPDQTWELEDDVIRAAKTFAQMFNGQLVDSDDETELSSMDAGTTAEQVSELSSNQELEVDPEDDDDIPF
jgi:DNA polymerase-3 subunit gamma/tau